MPYLTVEETQRHPGGIEKKEWVAATGDTRFEGSTVPDLGILSRFSPANQ